MNDPLDVFRLLKSSDFEGEPSVRPQPNPTAGLTRGAVLGGRYQIVGFLGRGGFADVFLGADLVLERRVAIKTLRESTPQRRERFMREAKVAASIKHPNVVTAFGLGEQAGVAYVVFELVEGAKILSEAVEDLDLDARLDLFEQLLAGVGAAHALGITHRDLKPDNVLVQAPGRLFVADFGLAHIPESNLTATGQFMGTPSYMAPEQTTGSQTSPATDVWALGLILYELLYDRLWYPLGIPLQELLVRIAQVNVERPGGAPPELERILFDEVLLQRPQDRLPDARAFLERVRHVRASHARSGNALPRALVCLALGLGAGFGLTPPPQEARPTEAPTSSPVDALSAPTSPIGTPTPTPSPATTQLAKTYGTPHYFDRRRALRGLPLAALRAEAEKGDLAALRLTGLRHYNAAGTLRDVPRALEYFERAADLGCRDSLSDLTRGYETLEGRDGPRTKAWRQRALEAGSLLTLLVHSLREDSASAPPLVKARRAFGAGDDEAGLWLARYHLQSGKKAAAEAWALAAIRLGSIEARGIRARLALSESNWNEEEIAADLEAAVQARDPTAIYETIRLHAMGQVLPKDLARARELLDLHAQLWPQALGDQAYLSTVLSYQEAFAGGGQFELKQSKIERVLKSGSPYTRGRMALFVYEVSAAFNAKDKALALERAGALFRASRRSIEARVHHQFGGAIQRRQIQSPNPNAEFVAAYRRGAELGGARSTTNLGVCYLKGLGVARNEAEGLRLLHLGARDGYVGAWLDLGFAQSNPKKHPKLVNYERAVKAFRKAGSLGKPLAFLRAATILADRKSGPFDPAQARDLVIRAVQAGEAPTRYAEGASLLSQSGALEEAHDLFRRGAAADEPEAIYGFAYQLLMGEGTTANPERAVEVLSGAKRPSAKICSLLAECYEEGKGVAVDARRAAGLRQQALVLAEEEAKRKLESDR